MLTLPRTARRSGSPRFTTVDSGSELRPYSSRASAKVDWDGDGFLDLLTVGLEGVPQIHREVPTQRAEPPRCTLVPINRYVPSYGFGFAIVPDDDPHARDAGIAKVNTACTSGPRRSSSRPGLKEAWCFRAAPPRAIRLRRPARACHR